MNSHYNEENLLVTVVNLFTASTDTTSTTLRYSLLLMARYPQIQGKEHNEHLFSEKYFIKKYID